MKQILVYGDSLSWGIVPGTRRRLPFAERWPGILERELVRGGIAVRVIEDCLNGRRTVWDDPFKPGRNGLVGLDQRIEVNSPLALVILMSMPISTRYWEERSPIPWGSFYEPRAARGVGAPQASGSERGGGPPRLMNELETERLKLRMWRESDLDDYAEMSADPAVMKYLTMGKLFTRADAWRESTR